MITVKQVRSVEDIENIRDIQKSAWGFEDKDCVPSHIHIAQNSHGGDLIAAYADGIEKPVGFVFLMYARNPKNHKPEYIMHMIAVKPEFQYKDISRQLAKKMICVAKEEGDIERIIWTYDPLQGANANTYFNKFGAVVREYILDMYGKLSGFKNDGLATDRFATEIDIRSNRLSRLDDTFKAEFDKNVKIVNECHFENGIEIPRNLEFIEEDRVYVRIPSDFSYILAKSPTAAIEWRNTTRKIFDEYINKREYIAKEFVSLSRNEKRENYYLLEKNNR